MLKEAGIVLPKLLAVDSIVSMVGKEHTSYSARTIGEIPRVKGDQMGSGSG